MIDYHALGEIIGGFVLVVGGLFGGKKWSDKSKEPITSSVEKSNYRDNGRERRVRESECIAFRTEFKTGLETMRKENREDFGTIHKKFDEWILKQP